MSNNQRTASLADIKAMLDYCKEMSPAYSKLAESQIIATERVKYNQISKALKERAIQLDAMMLHHIKSLTFEGGASKTVEKKVKKLYNSKDG